MTRKSYLCLAVLSFLVTPLRADPIVNTDNGGLNVTSIENLEFMGMLFDVTFPDGSFTDVFGSAPFPPTFLFEGDETGALAAMDTINALINAETRLPDTVGGLGVGFDFIPFATEDGCTGTAKAVFLGDLDFLGDFPLIMSTDLINASYAVFTKQQAQVVPEPSSILIWALLTQI